jgi:hypothetical protein
MLTGRRPRAVVPDHAAQHEVGHRAAGSAGPAGCHPAQASKSTVTASESGSVWQVST